MKVNDSLLPKRKNFFAYDVLIGIVFTIFLISAGVLFAIYFRPLYYLDISLLKLEEATGLSRQVIKANYRTLMDYCSPFARGELKFPTLPSSATGLSHFAEVKNIFTAFHITAALSLTACIIIFWFKKRFDYYGHLLVSAITAIAIPAVAGIAFAINFQACFVLMHKIFFRNDDWMFDADTDPIINLLPEAYFMHCGIIVLVILFIGSGLCFVGYYRSRNNRKTDSLLPMKKNYYY